MARGFWGKVKTGAALGLAPVTGGASLLADKRARDMAVSAARNVPFVGEVVEGVSPQKPDFAAAGQHSGGEYFEPVAQSAQDLYQRSLGMADTRYDVGDIDRTLALQNANLGSLQQAAAGNGPSAATQQYMAAQQQAQRAAMGQVAAARGADRGAARLQALSGFGEQAQQAAAETAALRAREQQAAMQQYTGALEAGRGQDLQSEAARRAAYQATIDAQQGAMQLAQGAQTAQQRAADAQAKSKRVAYEMATGQVAADEQRRTKSRQAVIDAGTAYATGGASLVKR